MFVKDGVNAILMPNRRSSNRANLRWLKALLLRLLMEETAVSRQRKPQEDAERTVDGEYARVEVRTCVMEIHVIALPRQQEQGMLYGIIVMIWTDYDVR